MKFIAVLIMQHVSKINVSHVLASLENRGDRKTQKEENAKFLFLTSATMSTEF